MTALKNHKFLMPGTSNVSDGRNLWVSDTRNLRTPHSFYIQGFRARNKRAEVK
jgi:hypothetical protein